MFLRVRIADAVTTKTHSSSSTQIFVTPSKSSINRNYFALSPDGRWRNFASRDLSARDVPSERSFDQRRT
jgi:hypothetical protein